MTVGERIKNIRLSKNLTQKQLGELCGMADSAIRRYELGGAKPKIETLMKIANALDVAVVVFIDDEHIRADEINDIMSRQRADDMGITKELASSLANSEIDILHLFKQLDDTGKQTAEDIIFTLRYLNASGQEKVVNYADDLSKIPEYQKEKE